MSYEQKFCQFKRMKGDIMIKDNKDVQQESLIDWGLTTRQPLCVVSQRKRDER